VIADAAGCEVVRIGLALGAGCTNNEAESTAAKAALEHLARLQDQGRKELAGYPIRVLGDSQLVIRHLLRLYNRSSKPSLYLALEGTKALVQRRKWRVAYRYVPRELNAPADDMCRRAREQEGAVEYWDGQLPEGAPPLELRALYREVDQLASGKDRVGWLSARAMGAVGSEVAASAVGESSTVAQAECLCALWDERLRGVACGTC
jgi:ribonuclease HI